MDIRGRIAQEIVELELFHTYMEEEGTKIPTYVAEGFDREKLEAEGSIWIVYVYDCMREYYQRHRERIEEQTNEILREALRRGDKEK
jgi:hypothetical protein